MKKGDIIYYAEFKRGKGYSGLYTSEVTYVGRKLFKTTRDNQSNILLSRMITGDQSDDHRKYFLKEQDFIDWKESIRIESIINAFFRGYYKLSIEKLRQIEIIIS